MTSVTGNGKGGESIYGGTFNDENFTLKHEKPLLLSMANRGKNTNGSQFFITLNPAKHLDGVHVVFGHVLSGQEVIQKIQKQETDKEGKPINDIKIAESGELIPQIAKSKEKKKKHRKEKSKKSEEGEVSTDEDSHKLKKKKNKHKKHKKEKEDKNEEEEKSVNLLAIECSVKAEEVPEIPENKFLIRESNEDIKEVELSRKRTTSSGRQFKGRGFRRFKTPPPTGNRNSRGRSETPEHWKCEQEKLKSFKEVITASHHNSLRRNRNRDSDRYHSERYRESYRNRESERNRDFGRNRFYGSDRFGQRDRFTDQDQLHSRFKREDSDTENIGDTERYAQTKRRIFTEEPPNRLLRRSSSLDNKSNDDEEYYQNDGKNSRDSRIRSNIERVVIKSQVRVNEDFNKSRIERKNSDTFDNKSQQDTHIDINDIPLPITDTNKKFTENETKKLNKRLYDSDLKRADKRKRSRSKSRSHSRDRSYKKISLRSRRRRHSSD
ncbi:peptidyl-prolyl cis-trans isomerase G-like isoform X2 [Oppia nitens]|uniref:peptidyl-prolyl cis-trans isomerase G-like isoform X2 n=1 Tax=Oppia nitens TaxID=1686743 RepID=UPI0023DA3ABA|nr:peptidyl-prolyl cis-trans isomerase G-like isoform X2 [Oppia nitens]